MAIVFTTGTISQPDAGSVGQAMIEQLRDDLVAHAAWELVEEFTPASGAVRWYVFRCLATASGLPANFYVVVGRTLSTGELRFAICEDYNATGHVMSFFPSNGSSSTINYDSSGRNPATYALSTVVFPTSMPNPRHLDWTPSGTSTKYWITADDDGFSVAFNGASNGFVHCGAYSPLTEALIDFPLQIMGSSDSTGGVTRNPSVASTTAAAYAMVIEGGGSGVGSAGQYGPALGFRGDLRYNDKLQANQRPVAEQGMNMYAWTTDAPQQNGWALGKQKRMRLGGGQAPAGFAFGDAYALGGSLWVPFAPTDLRVWDTGVAS